jgi:hypothetical protein
MNDVLLIVGVALIAYVVFILSTSSAESSVHKCFGLDPGRYKILGTDLGGRNQVLKLFFAGVAGAPDAIFEERAKRRIIIGEFKARKLRDGVRYREFYQVLLYVGLAKAKWSSHEVVGLLAYTDKTVLVRFDKTVFDALMAMRSEALEATRVGRALNPRPLHKRIRVKLPS